MATAYPNTADDGEDYFVLELKEVREQIELKFVEIIDCVKARKSELLKELATITESYHSYQSELEKHQKKKRDLEHTRDFHLHSKSENKIFHENILAQINNELRTMTFPAEPKMINFVCDNNRMHAELNKLGQLVERVRSSVDYKRKIQPVVSVCVKGIGIKQLNCPCGVAYDSKTSNIYVADRGNKCVKVFDNSGKILFKFGDSDGKGKMGNPHGLVISGDRIFISQVINSPLSHSIIIYQLNGNFISTIGKYGKSKMEFKNPLGLACNESNGDIYICDYNNNRVQILSKQLKFKSQFGGDKLKYPLDVNLSRKYIFILDGFNACLHLYNYDLVLQRSIVTRGVEMVVGSPCCFFIDTSDNILISDNLSNCIHVFNPQFELIHKIETANLPMGVAVDKDGRVIVACQTERVCLQIF